MATLKELFGVPVAGLKTVWGIPLADLKTVQGLEVGSAALLLDAITGCVEAWYPKKLKATATNWCRVRRTASGGGEQDIGFSGNSPDTAALLAFCGAGNGYVVKWYGHMGSEDAEQSSSGDQPLIVDTGVLVVDTTGLPATDFQGGKALEHQIESTAANGEDHTFIVILQRKAATAAYRLVFETADSGSAAPNEGISLYSHLGTAPWGTYDGSADRPANTTLAQDTRYVLVMRRSGGGTGEFFLGTTPDGTYSGTRGRFGTGAGRISLGGFAFPGGIVGTLLFDRAVTDPELATIVAAVS